MYKIIYTLEQFIYTLQLFTLANEIQIMSQSIKT